jgi:hypothetical protein
MGSVTIWQAVKNYVPRQADFYAFGCGVQPKREGCALDSGETRAQELSLLSTRAMNGSTSEFSETIFSIITWQ